MGIHSEIHNSTLHLHRHCHLYLLYLLQYCIGMSQVLRGYTQEVRLLWSTFVAFTDCSAMLSRNDLAKQKLTVPKNEQTWSPGHYQYQRMHDSPRGNSLALHQHHHYYRDHLHMQEMGTDDIDRLKAAKRTDHQYESFPVALNPVVVNGWASSSSDKRESAPMNPDHRPTIYVWNYLVMPYGTSWLWTNKLLLSCFVSTI